MGGFSVGSNPMVKAGAMAIDAYTGVPVASTALTMAEANAEATAMRGNYDRQAELQQRQQARAVEERQDLLRRTTATQRARLGALGVGAGGGSSEALINSLQRQGAAEIADINSAFADRLSMLDWSRSQQVERLENAGRNQMLGQLLPLTRVSDTGDREERKPRRRSDGLPPAGFSLL